jgi:Malic enzyme, N-terminal domain
MVDFPIAVLLTNMGCGHPGTGTSCRKTNHAGRTADTPCKPEADQEELARRALDNATKDHPWVNSLGMKFVPGAGTQVLFSVWDTRVQDFETFVKSTDYDATGGMYSLGLYLHAGTNNKTYLRDPLDVGLRQKRPSSEELYAFVDEFVEAVQEDFPNCCIHFEDWTGLDCGRSAGSLPRQDLLLQ